MVFWRVVSMVSLCTGCKMFNHLLIQVSVCEMNPFVQEDNKTMEPTCADDDGDDNDDEGLRSDQIRSFQHHGKRDSTSTCVRDPPVACRPRIQTCRSGSVRWNDARV